MAANDHYFAGSQAKYTYLAARGFGGDGKAGSRSGGILAPEQVLLPAGARLIRLFHLPSRAFGAWWSTVHEMALVCEHFARSSRAMDVGRSRGQGALQAVLAVRHEWAEGSREQLGRFMVAVLKEPLRAYHGPGDDAPDPSQASEQKALKILVGGSQRGVRQLFLPECWNYTTAFDVRRSGYTRGDLLAAVRANDPGPLSFEN